MVCRGVAVKNTGFKLWCLISSVGSSPDMTLCVLRQDTEPWLLCKVGEVVLFAVPARLLVDDSQAYIRMDCKGGNPISAPGVGGTGPWQK